MRKRNKITDYAWPYAIRVETGVILTLLFLIGVTNVHLPERYSAPVVYGESDEAALVLPSTIAVQKTLPKPPLAPEVPITLPDDRPLEIPELYFPEVTRQSNIEIPKLAREIEIEVDYDKLSKIELLPQMVGGEEAFRKSIPYPEWAKAAGIEGIVEVEFTVDENGRVLEPVITRGIGGGCDRAVLKAIKMQRYKPGKKAGKPAQFKIKETVQFILLRG
ncbi:energy transducer TonB [Gracilimonas mengyeensis]|uniref:Protein TonB n=1 Tax=Gracilimonas mengyeensis TaxID=1302730 RepID=A0A521B7S5_9BACT|nr:energy transducer TonB [Gracilimonas mengyeensis]SMO43051.1 protein TonB [Gracilimonas mengyeensis]